MKKTMKLFAAITIMSTFAIGAMAQNTNTDAAITPANAVVRQAITVAGITPLEFKSVSPGITKAIGLTNNVTGQILGGETTGVFTVSAAATSSVSLEFTVLPSNLEDGAKLLPIGTYMAGYANVNPYAGGTPFVNVNDPQTIASFPNNVVGTTNLIYVYIGGTLTPAADQLAGTYTADIQLTATYN